MAAREGGFSGHVNLAIQTSQGLVHRHVGQVKRSYLNECDWPSMPEKLISAPTPDVPLESPPHQLPLQSPPPQSDQEDLPLTSDEGETTCQPG